MGTSYVFQGDWRQLGDFPAILQNNGVPTPCGLEKLRSLDFEKVVTDWYRWMIDGGDVEPHVLRPSRIGDLTVATINDLARSSDPFFLRVSFQPPHMVCVIERQHFIDPTHIDLLLPAPAELRSQSRFEHEHTREYAGATLATKQISLMQGTYYSIVHLVDD